MIEPELIKIPAGTYTLGVPETPSGDFMHVWSGPVTVETNGFLVGETAVTVKEYSEYVLEVYGAESEYYKLFEGVDGNLPAGEIAWEDAFKYAEWLKEKTGKPYRLLTADEWEIAARGGLEGKMYPWGDEEPEGRCDYNTATPKPVKSFEPNGYGLYDIVGNMWTWCQDLWVDRVKHDEPKCTPTGKPPEINRILRGGSFLTTDERCLMCAYIHEDPPDLRHACLGMRLACDL